MRAVIVALLVSFTTTVMAAAQTTADADATTAATGLFSEPPLVNSAVALAGQWMGEGGPAEREGFYPDLGNMITGAGWISAGPGYRAGLFDGRLFVDASTAISWRAYKMAQARVELPDLAAHRLTVGSQVRWQDLTQVNYFGIGADTLEGSRSEYRLKDTYVVGYGVFQANRWLAITGTFGWLQQPTLSSPTGPFQDQPDALLTFPQDPGVVSQSSFLHGNVSIAADTRDYPGHPTAGGLYRASVATYSDRNSGPFSFGRYDVEGLRLLRVNGWSVLALHGRGVFSEASSGDVVPF